MERKFRELWAQFSRACANPEIGRQVLCFAMNPDYTMERIRREAAVPRVPKLTGWRSGSLPEDHQKN
jgi:hypothetical protein